MNVYIVKTYNATILSFFTQADHFKEYWIQSEESYPDFRKRLMSDGLQDPADEKHWLMPGAILDVYITPTAT